MGCEDAALMHSLVRSRFGESADFCSAVCNLNMPTRTTRSLRALYAVLQGWLFTVPPATCTQMRSVHQLPT